jgi:hypothetical protein
MYISTREGLGQTLGQHGLGQCDQTSAGSMTFVDILATIGCELQRKFAGPNDPKLFRRRRRLRELFNGVSPPKVKELFDQLQQKADPLTQLFRSRIAPPTQQELLSILFFAEYDLRLGPDIPTNPRMTAAQKANRIAQIEDATGQSLAPPPDNLLARLNTRAALAFALPGRVPGANPASAALRPTTVDLSTAQLNLFREFFPDGAGGINFDDFRLGFEQFANGELRDPAVPGKREPNGAFFFLFAEFAFLCVDSKINDADWRRLLRVFVQTQEIVIHIYRPAPHRAPPRVGEPPTCRVDAQGKRLPPRPLNSFSDANFNAVGQSYAARKAALRAKYARMDEATLRWAAQENLLRAQCMP